MARSVRDSSIAPRDNIPGRMCRTFSKVLGFMVRQAGRLDWKNYDSQCDRPRKPDSAIRATSARRPASSLPKRAPSVNPRTTARSVLGCANREAVFPVLKVVGLLAPTLPVPGSELGGETSVRNRFRRSWWYAGWPLVPRCPVCVVLSNRAARKPCTVGRKYSWMGQRAHVLSTSPTPPALRRKTYVGYSPPSLAPLVLR